MAKNTRKPKSRRINLAARIEGLTADPGESKDAWDTKVEGLHVRVRATSKTWRMWTRQDGKPKIITLGKWRHARDGGGDNDKWLSVSQARTKARAIAGRVEVGAPATDDGMLTVSELVKTVRREFEGTLTESTLRGYHQDERHIRQHIGSVPVESLTHTQVFSMFQKISKGGGRKGPQAGLTGGKSRANRAVQSLRRWINMGIRHGLVQRRDDPTAGIRRNPEWPNRRNILTRAEHERMLVAIGNGRQLPNRAVGRVSDALADALEIMLRRGLRADDLSGLEWDAVDLTEGRLILQRHKTAHKVGTKIVELGDVEIEILRRRWEVSETEAVFPIVRGKNRGRPIHAELIRRAWRRMAAIAGVEKTAHGARGGFVSRLVNEEGVPLPIAAELVSHRQISTTMRYVSVTQADQLKALGRAK